MVGTPLSREGLCTMILFDAEACDGPLPVLTDSALLAVLGQLQGATVAVVDRGLRVVYVNASFARWFGVPGHELIGRRLPDLYGAVAAAAFRPHLERAFTGEKVTYQRLVQEPGGRSVWHTISLVPWFSERGELQGLISSALPVHELQSTNEALRDAHQRLRAHMDNSPLAVVEMDADLALVHVSSRGQQWFGWRVEQHAGRSVLDLPGLETPAGPLAEALRRLQAGQELQNRVEATHRHPDGSLFHGVWFNSALLDAQGRTVSIMAQIEDVTELVESTQRLRDLARFDTLTGLINRGALMAQVDQSLSRVRGSPQGGQVALLFLDLDGFKLVNDLHGHRAGDEVLQWVARRLASAVRQTDTVARLGGDEFVVLLDNAVSDAVVQQVLSRILAAFDDPFVLPQGPVRLGVSVGVAVYPQVEGTVDELVGCADQAMYEAKRAGKGMVRYAEVAA
ncbi:diguanylate cyclase [Curvibacter sp. HBC61]|uniref:Diguanylate cyclase n=2 Tax=Curvibacter cyanobacteriorum TaxID=3026422 RepID=A0ABT5MVR4_9BURK|nr:diguanylate cyclase [Curvibacter sp. HBC61]